MTVDKKIFKINFGTRNLLFVNKLQENRISYTLTLYYLSPMYKTGVRSYSRVQVNFIDEQ